METFAYVALAVTTSNNRPRYVVRFLIIVALCLAATACAHVERAPDALSQRRLFVLERDFAEFSAKSIRSPEDIEEQIAALEAVRFEYVHALSKATVPRDRLLCLLRIAELHLDLGARIRRVPYPVGANLSDKNSFDEMLSQEALPLEAVGRGVLAQAIDYADTHGVDGRFVRRARLYKTLAAGDPLDVEEIAWLRRDLVDRTFGAP